MQNTVNQNSLKRTLTEKGVKMKQFSSDSDSSGKKTLAALSSSSGSSGGQMPKRSATKKMSPLTKNLLQINEEMNESDEGTSR